MTIEFQKISIQNFLSIGNTPIEILLNKSPTTLISGKNGSGKSILTDSLSFALYGKPYRKINIPQLINSVNRKNCLVTVSFKKGADEYIIERGLAPKIFNIHKNGVLINQDASSRDYQNVLEKNILSMTFKSFTQIVILSTSTFIPFMQLSCQERRNIIEDILDIQIFSKMNSLLKEKYAKEKDLKKDLISNEKLVNQKIEINKKHLEQYTKEKHDSVESIQEKITELHGKLSATEIEISLNESSRLAYQIELQKLNVHDFKAKQDSISRSVSHLEAIIKNLKKENDFFHSTDSCPTCLQHIDDSFKVGKIQFNGDTIQDHSKKIEELSVMKEKLSSVLSKMKDLQENINFHTNTIKVLNSTVSNHRENIASYESHLSDSVDKNKEGVTSVISEIKNSEEELKAIQIEKEKNLKNLRNYEIALDVLKDSGIKSKIIKQYIPVINKLINSYLREMDFSIQFNLNEEFEETIKSPYLERFSYSSFSEGEKARIDLALLFTWREISKLRNSSSTNILLLDEVFDGSLDEEARDSLLKILGTLKNTNVLVISHHETLFDKFHSYIKVTKQNGFTRIN
jgi:DNA repair exonuclease SbcCD ATPase subunit